MILYYYTDCEYLQENLKNRWVKVSRFWKYGTINDPFELTPYDTSDKKFRSRHKNVIDKVAKTQGLICLSETRRSPTMWAHYAKNHTGVCLEFEVTLDSVFKVNYASEKLFKGITLETYKDHINIENAKEVYGTKSDNWTYEEERRLLVPLNNPLIIEKDGHHFLPFQTEKDNTFELKRIWVGYKCGEGISNMRNYVKDYSHNVDVIQTRPSFKSFEVEKQRDKRFWNMDPGDEASLPAVKAVFGGNA